MTSFWWCAVGLLILLLTSNGRADEFRPAYIELIQVSQESWQARVKVARASTLEQKAQLVLPETCQQDNEEMKFAPTFVLASSAIMCEGSELSGSIGLRGLELTQTDALVRIQPLNQSLITLRLTPKNPIVQLREPVVTGQVATVSTSAIATAKAYLLIGVEHILFGYDHLLFVVALVLLLGGFRQTVLAATAFTLAHSVTLISTVYEITTMPSRLIEALIALSIVFMAREVLRSKQNTQTLTQKMPWLIALLFGLLHGFGFAGALEAIGLPQQDHLVALLSFNVGVELGQVVIVCIAQITLLFIAFLSPNAVSRVSKGAAYGIGGIGFFWVIERLF